MFRLRSIPALCAIALLAAVPSTARSEGTATIPASVTLEGDANGPGCAIWLEPAEPVRFGVPASPEDPVVSREFSLRVVNGQKVVTTSCAVTTGGASFQWKEAPVRSIHTVKLAQSAESAIPVLLVPQVKEMAESELQSVLVQSPATGGCAVVTVTLDTAGLPALPRDAVVTGTLTLTVSDVAP